MAERTDAAEARAADVGDDRPSRLLTALSWALALVPLGQLVYFLARYTTDVPLWDSWPFALLLDRFYSGKLTFGDLWMAHNEHRPFFSRLVLVGLAWLTHWQIGWELGANVVAATLGLLAVILGARAALAEIAAAGARAGAEVGRRPLERSPAFLLAPTLALLVYSLNQSYNWVCGWQLQFFLNLFAVEVGLVLLARPGLSWGRLAAAAALGVVATFTLASGFAYWILGAGALVLQNRPLDARAKRLLLAWVVTLGVVAALYVHGFGDAPPDARVVQVHPDRFFVFKQPLDFMRFVLRALGGPVISHHRNGAAIAGGLGLAAVAGSLRTLWVRGVSLRPLAGIGAISAYGLLNALALAFGRASFGRGNALLSRYMTLTTPFWLGVVVLLVAVIQTAPSREKSARRSDDVRFLLPLSTLAALVLAAAINAGQSFVLARTDYFEHMIPGREGVVTSNWELFRVHYVDVDGIAQTEQDAKDTLDQIAVLKRHQLGPFYENRGMH